MINNSTKEIFSTPNLEQPSDHEYLWKFIKAKNVDSFINGEIYFPQLLEFNDYYEAITPMYHLINTFIRRNSNIKIPNEVDFMSLSGLADRMLFSIEHNLALTQLKAITKRDDHEYLYKVLFETMKDINSINKQHIHTRKKIHANCWFIGDFDESALMWNSYSEKGGLAVKIKFEHFKRIMQNYFENTLLENIKHIKGGRVKYCKYYFEDSWLSDLEKGVPLGFFKHYSYKGENEYRILIEREQADFDGFNRIHRPFYYAMNRFNLILHPSATIDDYNNFKAKFHQLDEPKISFSQLIYS